MNMAEKTGLIMYITGLEMAIHVDNLFYRALMMAIALIGILAFVVVKDNNRRRG